MENLEKKLGLMDGDKITKTEEAVFEVFSDNPGDDADIAIFIEKCHQEFYEEKLDQISYLQGMTRGKPKKTKGLIVEVKVHLVEYDEEC